MSLNELNFIILLFFFLIYSFFFYSQTLFYLLILSELFWITLYLLVLVIAIYQNNLYILVLSLFFLIFSAIEISIGLLIIYLQMLLNNTIKGLNYYSYLLNWYTRLHYIYLL